MKNKFLSKVILFTFIFGFFVILNLNSVFASQNINKLEYDIEITNKGDMIISEKWNIDISDTNTLFKTFIVDESYDEITNVSVSEISEEGNIKKFDKKNEYQYHVDKDSFQALINPDNRFEIAWGVDQNVFETREFIIQYTVKGHITKYLDCSEVYWKLIGDDFEIPIDSIYGNITLPTGIANKEDFGVWAHGPLNGTINKDSVNKISFSVDNLPSSNYLEIRIATPNEIFTDITKISNNQRLSTIISEETEWANEANRMRESMKKRQEILELLTWILGVIVSIFLIYKTIKNYKKLKETPKLEPKQKLDYFREMPDEEASALEASFLYYFKKGGIGSQVSKIISASILNISLKGWISFEQELEDNKKIIIILNDSGKKALSKDEQKIYDFLSKIPKSDNKFTMKEFQKYCNKNTSECEKLIVFIPDIAEEVSEQKQLYSKKVRKKHNIIEASVVGYIFLAIMMIFVLFINLIMASVIILLSIINSIILIKMASRINGLTQTGIDEREKWVALKKYMEDFSMLNEREVPDLILWEKYLVFATAFGIADKVIKQLKVRYPELNDEAYIRHHYTYMHLACSNHNFNFINSMNTSIGSVTNYSSGTGSGGGFSAGGGFGGGGGGGGGR